MMQHRLSTTDPISMNEVNDLEGKPFLVVGTPHNDFSRDIGNNVDEGIDEG